MAFTEFLKSLTPLADVARILAGFGLISVLLALLQRYAARRRWRRYKRRIEDWLEDLQESDVVHPKELANEDWRVQCERLMTDSGFSPSEISQLLDTAVLVARGKAAEQFLVELDS